MKKLSLLLYLFFISFAFNIFAANTIDSLMIEVNLADEQDKPRLYNQLSKEYQNSNPLQSEKFAYKAIKTSADNFKEKADGYINLGIASEFQGKYNQAKKNYLKAKEIAEENNLREELARSFLNIAYALDIEANYDKAIQSLKKALEIYEELEDYAKINLTLEKLSEVHVHNKEPDKAIELHIKRYNRIKDTNQYIRKYEILSSIETLYTNWAIYDKSLEYALKLLELEDKLPPNYQADIYTSLGNVYMNLGKAEKSLEYHKQAKKIYEDLESESGLSTVYNNIANYYSYIEDNERAIDYYQKSIDIDERTNSLFQMQIPIQNIASIYYEQGNLAKSREYFNRALDISEKLNINDSRATIYNSLAQINLDENRVDKAENLFKKALKISRKENFKNTTLVSLDKLIIIEEKKGNDKQALAYSQEVIKLQQEIYSVESSEKIEQLQTKFDLMNKEKQIENLQKTNELRQIKLEKQNLVQKQLKIIIGVSIIAILLFALALIKFMKLNKKVTKEKEKVQRAYNELSRAQENIINLEKKNAVLAMAVTANHEIRQPLMILTANLEMLVNSIHSDELCDKDMKYIKQIAEAKERINKLLKKYENAEDISFKVYAEDTNMIEL